MMRVVSSGLRLSTSERAEVVKLWSHVCVPIQNPCIFSSHQKNPLSGFQLLIQPCIDSLNKWWVSLSQNLTKKAIFSSLFEQKKKYKIQNKKENPPREKLKNKLRIQIPLFYYMWGFFKSRNPMGGLVVLMSTAINMQ